MSYDPNQPYQPPVAPGYGPPPGYPPAGPPPPAKKGNGKLIIGIVGGLVGLCWWAAPSPPSRVETTRLM